jgi:hypothetical protein
MGCASRAFRDFQIQICPFFAERVAECRPGHKIEKNAILI